MATYDYKCGCGKQKEVKHGMNDSPGKNGEPPIKCECGGDMKKIITSAKPAILIGWCWYKDGYE